MRRPGVFVKDRQGYVLAFSLVCIAFQWMFHVVLALLNMADDKKLINFFNPYELFALVILIDALTLMIRNKKAFVFFTIFGAIVIDGLFKYVSFDQFPGNFLKAVQYFYGVLIVFLGFILILKKAKIDAGGLAQALVSNLVVVIGIATLGEFVVANFIISPTSFFFYNGLDLSNAHLFIGPLKIRPFGLSLYPQPNAFTLAALVILNYLCVGKMDKVGIFGVFCTLVTFSGTGIAMLILAVLVFSRSIILRIAIGSALVLVAQILTSKLSIDYVLVLFEKFTSAIFSIFSDFSFWEWMFGSDTPNFNVGTGLTTDWAYVDVLYEFGIVGLLAYIGIYYKIIRLALPIKESSRKFGFVFLLMLFNFHYPSLNYYVCQMAFGILAALNVYAALPLRRPGRSAQAAWVPAKDRAWNAYG